jgi:SAM-dependent methyltransferase
MVARHFVDRVETVFAVEPNAEMRRIATDALGDRRSYRSVNGLSNATTLPDNSVQLVTVGRALHWFPAESTRAEFRRILRPEGWLAIFSVPCTDRELVESLRAICTAENGWEAAVDKHTMRQVPFSFYFGSDDFRTLTCAGSVSETWSAFLGRISSMAPAPTPDHPRRRNFERALRRVFRQHADNDVLNTTNTTQITFRRLQEIPHVSFATPGT